MADENSNDHENDIIQGRVVEPNEENSNEGETDTEYTEEINDQIGQVEAESEPAKRVYELSETDAFVFDKFLQLLEEGEEGQKAVAASRLASLHSMTTTVKEHAALVGAILFMCEKFDIKVKATFYQDMKAVETELPLSREGRYKFDLIQQAIANLFAKMKKLNDEQGADQKVIAKQQETIQRQEEQLRLLKVKVANLEAVPPPPKIHLPYVIGRVIRQDDKPAKFRYITSDENSSGKLGSAKRFSTFAAAEHFLVTLIDNWRDVPIKDLAKYNVMCLHYMFPMQADSTGNTGKVLRAALERAETNKA